MRAWLMMFRGRTIEEDAQSGRCASCGGLRGWRRRQAHLNTAGLDRVAGWPGGVLAGEPEHEGIEPEKGSPTSLVSCRRCKTVFCVLCFKGHRHLPTGDSWIDAERRFEANAA